MGEPNFATFLFLWIDKGKKIKNIKIGNPQLTYLQASFMQKLQISFSFTFKNKNVQSPDRGTIKSYLVEEGSLVTVGQIIATINPIEAAGVLEEIEASLSNLKVRHVRLDAELENQSISVVKQLSSAYSKQ